MKPAQQSASDISLLYVEDDSDARVMTHDIIVRKYLDIRVYTAENGAAGLGRYRDLCPDIVITDLSMPVMDGICMAREIRHINPEAVIIAVTAHSDADYLMSAIELGINHYVLKPVNFRNLFSLLDTCIERIRMKQLLRKQHEHIRKLSRAVEANPCSVVITDAQGTIEYVNQKFAERTGYASDEAVGQNSRFLKSGLTPQKTYDQLWSTILAGREWHGEIRNRKKSGDLYWELVSISPVIDEEGAIANFVVVKEDITELKEAVQRVELLNADLKAYAIEQEAFNYTVSHDLRTPLTVINMFCRLIQTNYAGSFDKKCLEYLHDIEVTTKQMTHLITTLLDFSSLSRRELKRQIVSLSRIAAEVADELRQMEPMRQAVIAIAPRIKVEADPTLLRLLLRNLLGNSWKYTEKTDLARIEVGTREENGVTICFVRDNGIGFDMAHADGLFLPFRRLSGAGDYPGHGIGLATVKRIIERHGGSIRVEAQPGAGATFYFTLGPLPLPGQKQCV